MDYEDRLVSKYSIKSAVQEWYSESPESTQNKIRVLGRLYCVLGTVDVEEDVEFEGMPVGEWVSQFSELYCEDVDYLAYHDYLNLLALEFNYIIHGGFRYRDKSEINLAVMKHIANGKTIDSSVVKEYGPFDEDDLRPRIKQ